MTEEESSRVGVVLLNAQVALVVEQTVKHVGRVAHAHVDHLGAEGRVLVGDVGVERPAGFCAVLRIDVSGALGSTAYFEALAVRRGGRAVAHRAAKGWRNCALTSSANAAEYVSSRMCHACNHESLA